MMYHSSPRVIWTVAIILVLARIASGQVGIRVNEAAARIHFLSDTTRVELPVENLSHRAMPAHVLFELLDPRGIVQARAERNVPLPPLSTTINIDLQPTIAHRSNLDIHDLLYYRLSYSIVPMLPAGSPGKATRGILSVGEATPDIFDLHVVGPASVRKGGRYTLRVRAIHPVTARPVARVTVQASLDLDTDNGKPLLTRKAVTGRDGFVTLAFTLPDDIDSDDDEIDVKVTGTLGRLSDEADGELPIGRLSTASLSTDKPLYQPGQTLHVRLMAFGDDKKALANQPVTIEITDPENTVQYGTDVRTSRFGIAAADWHIPENLRLGTYQIQASFDDDRYEHAKATAPVKISRYELPTFTVTAKPDHTYYLPGQNAAVEIRADYLFGEPVRHGHVRVVRETGREWNYREQRWDVKEAETYEGDTDDQGRYVAHLDLTRDHDELEGEDYERFRDLQLAAYFTDSSTKRTEQRRFDVRISKEPIHVYVIEGNGLRVDGLPLEFYVSTDYADGSPAQCDVQVRWVTRLSKNGAGSHVTWEQPLRRVHTNRYGLAKVSGLKVPDDPDSGDAYLSLRATGRKGAAGHHTEELGYSDRPVIRVATDKTLYRPEDPIEVTLTSNQPDLPVFVEAIHDDRVLASQTLRVRGGRASLVFPPSDTFQDDVTIFAYGFGTASANDYSSAFAGSHTILFPKNHDLQLDVRPAKSTYRPGDEATVNFRVAGPEGGPLQSALGLVVVDKALEERQRADEEFGPARGFYGFRGYGGGDEECKGIRRSDLNKLDLSHPLPEGLELVAEVLLRGRGMFPNSFESDSGGEDLRRVFKSEIDPQILPLSKALDLRYQQTGEYPKTMAALTSYLASAGIQFDKLRDPWGQPYKAEFSVARESHVLVITSAGPDKRFGTGDDFRVTRMAWPYFKPHTDALERAVNTFHSRTGGYIRNVQALKSELAREGSDLDSWKDPWDHGFRYTFGVATTEYTVTVTSAGPDGRFGTEAEPSYDDFPLATVGIDYTLELQNQLDRALTRYVEESRRFPQNGEEFQKALQNSGIAWDNLKDPWGHRYYATFRQEAMYADRLTVESYEDRAQTHPQHTQILPVTKQINWAYIRCAGQDGNEGTEDDFTVAAFSRAILEQTSHDKVPVAARDQAILAGASGAISGTVTDITGAVAPGAKATAKNLATGQLYTATAGADGKYLLRNLPAGFYYVEVSMPGFNTYAITDVPVRSSSITQLDVRLRVGMVTQTVTVSASLPVIETTSSAVVRTVSKSGIASTSLRPNLSTPRLREYFPETLLWQPELVTDGKGHAHLNFPLAGNITTWKLAAVASTVNGEIGTAEKEIRAFQPFFIEHDPPRFLTTGDEIDLPVVLRNYLDHKLQANVEMQKESWFTLANPAPKVMEIAPRDSARQIFQFKAIMSVKQGKQRVTARSAEAGDAIEKTVTVRPNGEEKIATLSQVFREKATLDLPIPDNAAPGSLDVVLKIYPNLNAHVLESIEGILKRPHGCAEQIISSTYPSILYLRHAKDAEQKTSAPSQRAQKYVQLGYERLLSYRAPDGGFSYWGRGDADLALTAYAVKFLADASEFVAVDGSVVREAVSWLLHQAQPDGRWAARNWDGKEDARRSALVTAYIARMIAASGLTTGGNSGDSGLLASKAANAVKSALTYVAPQVPSMDEPYLIAAYALAAIDAGEESRASESLERLRKLEHHQGDASYWSLEMNTPFYGWGLAGRVETTALVLQAFQKGGPGGKHTPQSEELISRGLLFLLHNQDRYGVWFSTQATVNVLDAMASLMSPEGSKVARSQDPSAVLKAEIFVDGRQVLSVDLPPGNKLSAPIVTDLSSYLSSGAHRVEIRRTTDSSIASAQLVADYYVPWMRGGKRSDLHQDSGASESLRLAVRFDKDSVKPGESVQCDVLAERIGYRGYGMMLAEIGLPPGAEVDRASLERAMKASDWGISQYDILPDRVVFYLWPRAGEVKFSFNFKPRYGLKALTTPSVLYDYYNPEAHAVVEPVPFLVQ